MTVGPCSVKGMPSRTNADEDEPRRLPARTALVAGPASETSTPWLRGLRSRAVFTGTGLAQPKKPTAAQREQGGHDERADRVDVRDRVERQPPGPLRGVVTERSGHHPVGDLVEDDRGDHRRRR